MKINKNLIKEYSDLMLELNLSKIKYSDGKISLELCREEVKKIQSNSIQIPINENEGINPLVESNDKSIKAPLVGTIYLKPDPAGKPFIEIGANVKIGQVLLIIEAMKTMNEITANKEGVVKKIYVTDGSPVEFGEPLVLIE